MTFDMIMFVRMLLFFFETTVYIMVCFCGLIDTQFPISELLLMILKVFYFSWKKPTRVNTSASWSGLQRAFSSFDKWATNLNA